jgi:hypothetical protein
MYGSKELPVHNALILISYPILFIMLLLILILDRIKFISLGANIETKLLFITISIIVLISNWFIFLKDKKYLEVDKQYFAESIRVHSTTKVAVFVFIFLPIILFVCLIIFV